MDNPLRRCLDIVPSLAAVALVALASAPAIAGEVRIATFNMESGSDTQVFRVAETIRDLGRLDVLALQEVEGADAAIAATVAAASSSRDSYRYVIGESGTISSPHRLNDHLVIVYNSSKYRQIETIELHAIRSEPEGSGYGKSNWGLRGALFLRLQAYADGREFILGNVHLKCCGSGKAIRAHQARILTEWIARADVPVILTGDFNIPVEPDEADGAADSAAFTTLNGPLAWVRPSNPIKTQCSPDYNSMLDHVFVDRDGAEAIEVTVHETSDAYCAAEKSGGSDHRPVSATVSIE